MSDNKKHHLLKKYLHNQCEEQERREVLDLLEKLDPEELDTLLHEIWNDFETVHTLSDEDSAGILNSILQKRKVLSLRFVSVAASVVFGLFAVSYVLYNRYHTDSAGQVTRVDVKPGGNKAELIMADGRKIVLGDGVQTINLANAHGVIKQTKNGTLVYDKQQADNSLEPAYDILRTPKGGVYQINLSDGTKVWLNAASALKYPQNFGKKQRDVELLYGEAYFEVTHRKDAPFSVKTSAGIIRDLGTQFNVNSAASANEVAATLIEGIIQVENKSTKKRIKPGQQVVFNKKEFNVSEVDIDNITAWKEGYFMFDEKLESALQKISLWYDVDIRYKDEDARNIPVLATITRYTNIAQVLHILELTKKVHFKLEGRTITVSSKTKDL